jgi:hypothetical protein
VNIQRFEDVSRERKSKAIRYFPSSTCTSPSPPSFLFPHLGFFLMINYCHTGYVETCADGP